MLYVGGRGVVVVEKLRRRKIQNYHFIMQIGLVNPNAQLCCFMAQVLSMQKSIVVMCSDLETRHLGSNPSLYMLTEEPGMNFQLGITMRWI